MEKETRDIIDKIYAHRKKVFSEKEREQKGWYASQLGTCNRKQVLARLGVPSSNEITAEGIGRMKIGKDQEERLIEEMKEAGIPIIDKVDGEQIRVELGSVSGRLDAEVLTEPLEIKSQNSKSFWYDKKRESKIKHSHQFQLGFYLLAQNKSSGKIIYISKDDATMVELEMKLTPQLKRDIQKKIRELDDFWSRGVIPPAIPDESWECSARWCPYYTLCQELGKSEKRKEKLNEKTNTR